MLARFYSDIALENFVDEAFAIHEVEVATQPGTRVVTISTSGHLTEEMRALVHINGGMVLDDGP